MESKTNSFAKSSLRSQILIYKDALAFVERLSYRKHGLKLWKEQMKRDKVPVNKRRDNSYNKRRETHEQEAKDFSRKEIQRCKFCGRKHRAAKKSCPAFGKSCSFCGRMNHFASQCFTKTKVNLVESESESKVDEYCGHC